MYHIFPIHSLNALGLIVCCCCFCTFYINKFAKQCATFVCLVEVILLLGDGCFFVVHKKYQDE